MLQLPDSIPIFDIKDREGNTEYIDFLKENEINYPVMKGVDKYKREFVTIKANMKFYDINDNIICMFNVFETFFKRYTEKNIWMGCGNFGKQFMSTTGGLTKIQDELLLELINNKTVKILKNNISKYNIETNISNDKNINYIILSIE